MDLIASNTIYAAVVIVIVMKAVTAPSRKAIAALKTVAARETVKALFPLAALALGIGAAAIPAFLAGATFGERLPRGLLAGALAVVCYDAIVKRVQTAINARVK